jgi:hypothetical protein
MSASIHVVYPQPKKMAISCNTSCNRVGQNPHLPKLGGIFGLASRKRRKPLNSFEFNGFHWLRE